MATYTAETYWNREGEVFSDGRYSRVHEIRFDSGHAMAGSSSPHVVREPMSSRDAVDPEEMMVASLSSCHMLTFLYEAQRAGLIVDRYHDEAEGLMAKNAEGKMALVTVTLRPRIAFSGQDPDAETLERLHHRAHEGCFIANSVKTEVRVEPR